MFGPWIIYLGPVGLNLSAFFLGLFVLILAIVQELRAKRTRFFEISLLIFLLSFLFPTLHGRLLQYIFPISLPEKPLLDNNLTFNYFLTNMLAYVICPVLVLILLRSPVSRMALGLKVQNAKQTALYAFFGLVFIVPIFMLSHAFFGYRWITEYTTTGLV
ncbi:MAG: hypothetical protein QXU67_06815, partial [Candidatus Bathyarchaeia archaeon]